MIVKLILSRIKVLLRIGPFSFVLSALQQSFFFFFRLFSFLFSNRFRLEFLIFVSFSMLTLALWD